MRRSTHALVLPLVAAIMLAACTPATTVPTNTAATGAPTTAAVTPAPATPAPSAAAEKVTLTIAGFGPGEKQFQPIWNEIKTAYEQVNPNVTVELVGIAYENLRTQLIVQATANTAPDIAQVDTLIDLDLASLGALAPLDTLLSDKLRSDLVPSLLENSTYNGKIYAIPQSPVPHLLWMNKTLVSKAGLDPDKPITTWDEFEATARAVSALGKDAEGSRIWGMCNSTGGLPLFAGFQQFPVFAAFGNQYFDAEGKLNLTSPEAVAALTWIKTMVTDGVLGPPGVDIRENRTLFAKGLCGFQVDNTGARGIYRDLSGKGEAFDAEWRIMPWPGRAGNAGIGLYYAHSFVIFEQSERKAEAMDFLTWLLTDPTMMKKYFDATGGLPPTQSLLATYTDDYSNAVRAQMESWKRPGASQPAKINEILTFVGVAISDAVQGGNPADTLADAEKNLKLILGQ